MSAEEKKLREYRRKNLAQALGVGGVEPITLARALGGVEPNYISQLKNGFRPITFEVARQIEKATGAAHLIMESPPGSAMDVSGITDKELRERLVSVLDEVRSKANKRIAPDVFKEMVELSLRMTRASGYNEGSIRFLAQEAFK